MQAVRQADLRLGESCNYWFGTSWSTSIFNFKSIRSYSNRVDISEAAVKQAKENNAVDIGITRNTTGIEQIIQNLTNGYGVDAVIIAAATTSLDPINFAGAVARKKGKVVVLGAVPTGFERDPFWYRKELELKMACSYGPLWPI